MSRARSCGAAGAASGDQRAASRAPVTKAADDSFSRNVRPNHESKRSRSRNKIPKSVRYELENSLVGLCDVWFEEIKPHLVRNNIKLHVHDADASAGASPSAGAGAGACAVAGAGAGAGAGAADCAGAGCSSGDHQQQQALPTTLRCSHLDPGAAPNLPRHKGASYAGSCSTPPTVSKAPCSKLPAPCSKLPAPCPKLPAPARRNLPSPASIAQTPRDYVQMQHHSSETRRGRRPHSMAACTRRKKRITQSQSISTWRVPRLCRTYSVLPSVACPPSPRPFDENYVRELFKSVYNKAPSVLSTASRHRCKVTSKSMSTQTEPPPSADVVHSVALHSCSSENRRRTRSRAPRGGHNRGNIDSLSATHYQTYHQSFQNQSILENPVLFQNDLIDIIGEKHDQRLKIIYNSPEQVKYPSVMNLVSPNTRQRKAGGPKKMPPWR